MATQSKPVLLLILDGWGLAATGDPCWPDPQQAREHSAIELARTPNWDRIWRDYPHTQLIPHGTAVGLTEGQMGNSEVGHLNLGAGRVVWQDLLAISRLISTGGLAGHAALQSFLGQWRGSGRSLHCIGLFSDGGVHSHIEHLRGLLAEAARVNPEGRIAVHALLDGRDTEPRIAERYFEAAEQWLPPQASFASLGGRYFAMDRDKRWERVKKGYDAIVHADGPREPDWREAMALARRREEGDEFVTPTILGNYEGMRDGDFVLCFNFRADRMRQLVTALTAREFEGFERGALPALSLLSMKRYSDDQSFPVLLDDTVIEDTLAELVSRSGAALTCGGRIYKSAETEKYAHVTYFFNGGLEAPWPCEERVLVPSPKVATYDLQPEMSVYEVTQKLCAALREGQHDLYVVNFANGDMVGHTGVKEACIRACEAVDACLGQVLDAAAWGRDTACLVTADHGNCDVLAFPDGTPHTQHSMNNSPLVLLSEDGAGQLQALRDSSEAGQASAAFPEGRRGWSLCDIAPTILALLGLEAPASWNGESLLQ
ncbi:2,3-bisphosphoglycerate-independent phosphoglycerate mutase [bacterium]|nr:2,3-bisphosphoglycerate-independent phosphoglycerate mutase [bacterium]